MAPRINTSDEKWRRFRDRIAGREGHYGDGRTGRKFLGRYQLGEKLLNDIGWYNVCGEKPKFETKWEGQWTGQHGVWSRDDFLNSPAAQDAAFDAAMQKRLEAEIIENGYDKLIGQKVGGITITWGGLLAAAWLSPNFLKRFIRSGGTDDPADANGDRASSRAGCKTS